jgi:predicted CXXCH cytochrome family protein
MKKKRRTLIGAVLIVLFLMSTTSSFSQVLDRFVPPKFTPSEISNDECMACHSDDTLTRDKSKGMKESLFVDYPKFKYSTHNVNGVGCVNCHSDITELNYDNEVPHGLSLPVNCDNCHKNEGEAYLDSVHKKAGGKGITIPCYACHGYHFISHLESNSVYERENGFCLKCHNPDKFHDWLPQKDTHFSFVECTVCHALDAPRYVSLRFYDLVSEKFLDGDEFLKALNTDYDHFMSLTDTNKDKIINLDEFENMILVLRQRDIIGTFHGEVVVDIVPAVHHVNRGKANRDCERCHNPSSEFFREVNIVLNKPDGTSQINHVAREVLSSYYVNHFYALGGTRVRLLDKIGIALLIGGVCVVAGHLSVRILTAPIRRRRREKEKREEISHGRAKK